MQTSDRLRRQISKSLTAQQTETVVNAAIHLWEQLAIEIISIVGEGGFNSLYARSVFLAQARFPWLAASSPSPPTNHRFAALKMSLEGQTPAQAREATSLLLTIFFDILVRLIGEELSANLLHLAWGDTASDSAGKEFKNG